MDLNEKPFFVSPDIQCEFLWLRSGVVVISVLLGCDTVSLAVSFPEVAIKPSGLSSVVDISMYIMYIVYFIYVFGDELYKTQGGEEYPTYNKKS
jgi:hypothetical protein